MILHITYIAQMILRCFTKVYPELRIQAVFFLFTVFAHCPFFYFKRKCVKLTLKHKHILFGLFYRPPNSNALFFSSIEDSIHLAVDTSVQYIIVTGDFNYNMLNSQTSSKIKSNCEQFSFTQTINAPTHFTDHSSSLIDIILTMNTNHLLYCKISDPFLN